MGAKSQNKTEQAHAFIDDTVKKTGKGPPVGSYFPPGRLLVLAGLGRSQQAETKLPLRGGNLLSSSEPPNRKSANCYPHGYPVTL